MASTETKVIVMALLLLGVGFAYTSILERQKYTGAAISEDYVTTPEPYGEIDRGTYGEPEYDVLSYEPYAPSEPVYEAPAEGLTSQQQAFLQALAKDIDPATACTKEKLGPFGEIEGIVEKCLGELGNLKANRF